MTDILSTVSTRRGTTGTPQNQPASERQVKNSAGGYGFKIDSETQLRRFLTIGSEGGTYYASAPELTKANAKVVLDWAEHNSSELVRILTEISVAGRAPRQNPAIFALAAAISFGDRAGKDAAVEAVTSVIRTGTHMFLFVKYAEQFRGWGRALKRAVSQWYVAQDVNKLAYQMVKYRQREGWTHLDVLRSIHPKVDGDRNGLFGWAAGKTSESGLVIPDLPVVQSYLSAQTADKLPLGKATKEWTRLVQGSDGLPWEALPDRALKQQEVWAALLDKGMPQGALIRQLPRLTNLGLLDPMGGGYTKVVTDQLTNGERLAKARIHPVSLLLSMKTYASGASLNGKSTWSPVSKVTDALDAAYYASYPHVTPAGKRTLLGLDISGSMGHPAGGLPISCREVTAAMSLVTMATEPAAAVYGFTSSGGGWRSDTSFKPLDISPRQRLDDAVRKISGLPFGGTDCSLPMYWAADNKVEVDTFITYTDNETWAGRRGHPHEALAHYRQQSGIDARLAVVAITPTPFSIADPSDPGSMDVSGFDSSVPALLADFSRGDI